MSVCKKLTILNFLHLFLYCVVKIKFATDNQKILLTTWYWNFTRKHKFTNVNKQKLHQRTYKLFVRSKECQKQEGNLLIPCLFLIKKKTENQHNIR